MAKGRPIFRGAFGPPSGSILVCQADAASVRGHLVKPARKTAKILTTVESRNPDLFDAVREVADNLKSEGYGAPKRAFLVTPSAVSGLLELPVDPKKPRPPGQMQELIRWELEVMFAVANEIWEIGAILTARGYITPTQRADIAGAAPTGMDAPRDQRALRFGEVALQRGWITQEQLDECLSVQEKMIAIDDDILCGWTPQTVRDIDGTKRHLWYAAGIARSLRDTWSGAFQACGMKLERIYPLLGSAFSALPFNDKPKSDRLLVEVHADQVACVRGNSEFVTGLRVEKRNDDGVDAAAAMCRELMRQGNVGIYVAGGDPRFERELAGLLREKVERLEGDAPSIIGAGAHALNVGAAAHQTFIDGSDPPEPLWKKPDTYRVAAAVVVLFAVLGNEYRLQTSIATKTAELAALDIDFEERVELNKQLVQAAANARALEQALFERRAQVEAARQELELVRTVLHERQSKVPGLLRALRNAVNDEVIVDSIVEAGQTTGYFEVSGWALSDTSAQMFINKLDATMQPFGLAVTGVSVTRARSRLELEGYDIALRLIPRPPEVAAPAEGEEVSAELTEAGTDASAQ